MQKTLADVVAEKPFHDFREWWDLGKEFVTFMARAVFGQWIALPGNSGDMQGIRELYANYIVIVFERTPDMEVIEYFCEARFPRPLRSGEFDGLSYAFFRNAFEVIESQPNLYEDPVRRERRQFTKRVGATFFDQLWRHLQLDLPGGLESDEDFKRLMLAIKQTGAFLEQQGYLRTHFGFRFDVDVTHEGRKITQHPEDLTSDLQRNGVAYALYEMGYPAILPSAVYLYHTVGEAQHHSSRTIEELFDRVGYEARETDDFDPIGFPSDRVIELWQIRRRSL